MSTIDLESSLVRTGIISDKIGTCRGAKGHSPRPLVVVEHPLYPGGPTAPLCGMCWDNYRALWSLLDLYHGVVPWELTRRFGNTLLSLCVRSWNEHHSEVD